MVKIIKRMWPEDPLTALILFIGLVTAFRITALFTLPFDLYPDEAQYWTWSLEPAFGYFSKPPLIAWAIGLSTAICGNGEACIRLSSPIFHAFTALVVCLAGWRLYDMKTGIWAAFLYVTLPAVVFSSLLVSTDVPLLLFWTLALLFFWVFLQEKSTKAAVGLGIAVGLGVMSKYAMLYFILCAGFFIAMTLTARWVLKDRRFALAGVLALLIVAPNIAWNLMHGGVTIFHTASNANLNGDLFHPEKFLAFVVSQLGVFGPLALAILCFGFSKRWQKGHHSDRFLIFFSLPILAMIAVLAFVSRANANWAAPAYIGLTLLVGAWLMRAIQPSGHRVVLSSQLVIMAVFTVLLYLPPHTFIPNFSYPFHRVVGWQRTASEVSARLKTDSYSAILTSDRDIFAELSYYLPPDHPPLAMWKSGSIGNHYELAAPLDEKTGAHPLFVTTARRNEQILKGFGQAEYLGSVRIVLGRARTRIVRFYGLADLNDRAR